MWFRLRGKTNKTNANTIIGFTRIESIFGVECKISTHVLITLNTKYLMACFTQTSKNLLLNHSISWDNQPIKLCKLLKKLCTQAFCIRFKENGK